MSGSFKRFQRQHKHDARINPGLNTVTFEQFVLVWRQAIQKSIASLDPSKSHFIDDSDEMIAEYTEDNLELDGCVGDEILQTLLTPFYDQIIYRSCFGSIAPLPEDQTDEKHRFFVQKWKEYIEERKDDPELYEYEKGLFLTDRLDTAVREHLCEEMRKFGQVDDDLAATV